MHQQRRHVAGIDVGQDARCGIIDSVEKHDDPRGRRMPADHEVQKSDQVPSRNNGPGTPKSIPNGSVGPMRTRPMPRNRLTSPINASSSEMAYTIRRAGVSFMVNAKNSSRACAKMRRCHGRLAKAV